jgi:hypothetical protein
MKSGDLVVPKPYNHLQEKFDLYEGEFTPFELDRVFKNKKQIKIEEVAVILLSYTPKTGGVFHKLLTSSGEIGWAHENWLRRIDSNET